MSNTFSNSDNIIDSRDVIERIAELEGYQDEANTQAEDWKESIAELEHKYKDSEEIPLKDSDRLSMLQDDLGNATTTAKDGTEYCTSDEFTEDEYQELQVLKALEDEASGYASDWRHGEALIRDSYFEEYAQELAEDIGAINKDARWPNDCIDWERAADELKQDYTSVDFDGVTYWIR